MANVTKTPIDKFFSRGLVLPFRRDQNKDFANRKGSEVFKSNLSIILSTVCSSNRTEGEVPFNQNLGSLLQFVRHRNMDDDTTGELIIYYVVDAVAKNEPSISIRDVQVIKNRPLNTITIRLVYDILDIGSRRVIKTGEQYEVTT